MTAKNHIVRGHRQPEPAREPQQRKVVLSGNDAPGPRWRGLPPAPYRRIGDVARLCGGRAADFPVHKLSGRDIAEFNAHGAGVLRPAHRPSSALGPLDGGYFKDALAERGMSQRQLAQRMGIDPASVHRLLTGKRPMRLDEVVTLARLLRVSTLEILGHAGLDVEPPETWPIVGFFDECGEMRLFVRGN